MTGVAIGYVHDTKGPSHSWYASMWAMKNFDALHGRLIRCELADQLSKVDGIAPARNEVVRKFLGTDCDWLLMVDRDMGWRPDALHHLLSAADPTERPIIGGLCFAAWANEGDGMGGYRVDPVPTLYRRNETGFGMLELYPADMVIRVDATGAAFLLIHRSVLEKLGSDWFSPIVKDGKAEFGEDFSFCVRAGKAGFPIHVHTGVKTTHHKEIWLSEEDYWRQFRVPPADEEVAVVVPEVRPEHAARFARSLVASTGLAMLYVGDEWRKADEPWFFLTGDDVDFHPGWLDHAQYVGNSFQADVVQVNGRGVLARRAYVEEFGDDWPGLVAAAKVRGSFQVALGARVEVCSDDED